jgi:hypothetical protein
VYWKRRTESPSRLEVEELDVDLHVVTGHGLLVPLPGDRALARVVGQAVEAVALEDLVDAPGGDLDAVVALQVPGDADVPEVVGLAQVEDILLDVGRRAQLRVLGAGLAVDQSPLAVLLVGAPPLVKDLARNAEVAAGGRDVATLLGVVEDAELARDVPLLLLCHGGPPNLTVFDSPKTCQPRS